MIVFPRWFVLRLVLLRGSLGYLGVKSLRSLNDAVFPFESAKEQTNDQRAPEANWSSPSASRHPDLSLSSHDQILQGRSQDLYHSFNSSSNSKDNDRDHADGTHNATLRDAPRRVALHQSRRAAVVLFGNSYVELNRPSGAKDSVEKDLKTFAPIDFRRSVENYKDYIFSFLASSNFSIDVFVATNKMEGNMKKALLAAYKPRRASFDDPSGYPTVSLNRWIDEDDLELSKASVESRKNKLKIALAMCADQQRQNQHVYDGIIVTRFDLIFKQDFARSALDWNVMNLVHRRNAGYGLPPHGIDDNFYAFPGSMLSGFEQIQTINFPKSFKKRENDDHDILGSLKRFVGEVHFLNMTGSRSWMTLSRVCFHEGKVFDITNASCYKPSRITQRGYECDRGCLNSNQTRQDPFSNGLSHAISDARIDLRRKILSQRNFSR